MTAEPIHVGWVYLEHGKFREVVMYPPEYSEPMVVVGGDFVWFGEDPPHHDELFIMPWGAPGVLFGYFLSAR